MQTKLLIRTSRKRACPRVDLRSCPRRNPDAGAADGSGETSLRPRRVTKKRAHLPRARWGKKKKKGRTVSRGNERYDAHQALAKLAGRNPDAATSCKRQRRARFPTVVAHIDRA